MILVDLRPRRGAGGTQAKRVSFGRPSSTLRSELYTINDQAASPSHVEMLCINKSMLLHERQLLFYHNSRILLQPTRSRIITVIRLWLVLEHPFLIIRRRLPIFTINYLGMSDPHPACYDQFLFPWWIYMVAGLCSHCRHRVPGTFRGLLFLLLFSGSAVTRSMIAPVKKTKITLWIFVFTAEEVQRRMDNQADVGADKFGDVVLLTLIY